MDKIHVTCTFTPPIIMLAVRHTCATSLANVSSRRGPEVTLTLRSHVNKFNLLANVRFSNVAQDIFAKLMLHSRILTIPSTFAP